jgi:hypothetical protein
MKISFPIRGKKELVYFLHKVHEWEGTDTSTICVDMHVDIGIPETWEGSTTLYNTGGGITGNDLNLQVSTESQLA